MPAAIMYSTPEPYWRHSGAGVLSQPLLNKDGAFTDSERAALGLGGLLPWRCTTIEQQVAVAAAMWFPSYPDVLSGSGAGGVGSRRSTLGEGGHEHTGRV